MRIVTHTHGLTQYYQKGESPRLIIIGGMHGNEYETSQLAEMYVLLHTDEFPPFLFIPQASPTAVAKKMRKNKYGHDLNRNFIPLPFDEEATTLMHILSSARAQLCIDFHEDPDRTKAMYMYDTSKLSQEQIMQFRANMRNAGASLYSGIDDADDANLGFKIDEGYISTEHEHLGEFPGFSSSWITRHKVAKRVLTIEIPGKATLKLKEKLVAGVFSFFLPFVS